MKINKVKGFSLAELGIALVIVLVVATIAVISYFTLIDNSKEVKVIEEASTIKLALSRQDIDIKDYSNDHKYEDLDNKVKEVLEYHLEQGTNLRGLVFPNEVILNDGDYILGELRVKKSVLDGNTALLDTFGIEKVKAEVSGSNDLSVRKLDNNKVNRLLQDSLKGDWFVVSSTSGNAVADIKDLSCLELESKGYKCIIISDNASEKSIYTDIYRSGYDDGYYDGSNNLGYNNIDKPGNSGNYENPGLIKEVVPSTEIPEGYIPIYTVEDLDNVRNGLHGKYILMNDLDLSHIDNWEPIGRGTSLGFRGIFNGNGYKISGMNIYEPNVSEVGLFSKIYGNDSNNPLIIENLTLENINVEGLNYTGGLVGYVSGGNSIINNITVTGKIKGHGSRVGGIVGHSSGKADYIYNSFVGDVLGDTRVGGIIGFYENSYRNFGLERSFSDGIINGNTDVGGIIGFASGVKINDSYSNSTIYGDNVVGGILGNGSTSSTRVFVTITNNYFNGKIDSSGDTLGGVAAVFPRLDGESNNYWNSDKLGIVSNNVGQGKTTKELKTLHTFLEWDFRDVWEMEVGITFPSLKGN